MHQYQRRRRGHVLHLPHLNLTLLGSLLYRVAERSGILAKRNLGDGESLVVDFLNLGAYLHRAATLAVIVFCYIQKSACGEIGIQFKRLIPQISDRRIDDLIEIMWKYLR